MKLLIINASPRKNGSISRCLELMKAEAESAGVSVKVEYAQNWNMRPCIACMKCRSSKNCVLPQDDSQRVLALIQECDALIVGSPTYWGNMPATLKQLFDRIVYGLMDENRLAMPLPLHKGADSLHIKYSVAFQYPHGPDRRCGKGHQGSNRNRRFQGKIHPEGRNQNTPGNHGKGQKTLPESVALTGRPMTVSGSCNP